jgi:hypothetical protein
MCDENGNTWYCYQWFAAENASSPYNDYGCPVTDDNIWMIDPAGDEYQTVYNGGFPCYTHNTLPTLLDSNNITWRYYAQSATDLWTAPNSIWAICEPIIDNQNQAKCSGSDWINNVYSVLPKQGTHTTAPILDDIGNCDLPQVSWVVPDGNWSDHAGSGNAPGDAGPSWVAAIVNAIGGVNNNCGYWGNTVVLVTWDDWGGWYDDVPPPDCNTSTGTCSGYFRGTNKNGQQYVYGFRVPLLVIGAYTNQSTTTIEPTGSGVPPWNGYISGPATNPNCVSSYYCHDFGSILNFIEYAFGTGGNYLSQFGISQNSGWQYADYLAMDASPTCLTCSYSLADFFNFSSGNYHEFQPIQGAEYGPDCFTLASACFHSSYPQAPDDDEFESATD